MRKAYIVALVISCFAIGLASCEKEEGEGGKAVITGKVMAREFSEAGNLVGEYYIAEKRTYIIYGDGTTQDDDIRTSYDGSYRFEYLRKGDYTIYVMSDCDTCISGERPVMAKVSISKNDDVITVPDIVIEQHQD